jgi:hypothetical protein
MKNTFDPRLPYAGSTMYGTMTPVFEIRANFFDYWTYYLPMMQFQNQLAAVEMATPLERIGSWKISPMMTQPAGPQVL